MVGLIPLCAVQVFEQDVMEQFPELPSLLHRLQDRYPDQHSSSHDISLKGHANRHMMSALNETNLRRVLKIMLDPDEFLSDHGIRSISKRHEGEPLSLCTQPTAIRCSIPAGGIRFRPVWRQQQLARTDLDASQLRDYSLLDCLLLLFRQRLQG